MTLNPQERLVLFCVAQQQIITGVPNARSILQRLQSQGLIEDLGEVVIYENGSVEAKAQITEKGKRALVEE